MSERRVNERTYINANVRFVNEPRLIDEVGPSSMSPGSLMRGGGALMSLGTLMSLEARQ